MAISAGLSYLSNDPFRTGRSLGISIHPGEVCLQGGMHEAIGTTYPLEQQTFSAVVEQAIVVEDEICHGALSVGQCFKISVEMSNLSANRGAKFCLLFLQLSSLGSRN
jgi:hypothetical protein